MPAQEKDNVERTKSKLNSSPFTDTLFENLVAVNNSQFVSCMNDVVILLDTQETDSFD